MTAWRRPGVEQSGAERPGPEPGPRQPVAERSGTGGGRWRGACLRRLAAILVLLAAGCGGDDAPTRPAPPRAERPAAPAADPLAGVDRVRVGEGARAAWVLRPHRARGRLPGVLFLHGWTAIDPRLYGPWLRHLVDDGNQVVFPVYQAPPFVAPRSAPGAMAAGVRAALDRAPVASRSLVAVGFSAGGALAVDYAARARARRLPVPRAVMAIYPASLGIFGIASSTPRRIAGDTRLAALAGTRDTVVGEAPARRIVAGATALPRARRTLTRVDDPRVAGHLGPQQAGAAARDAFWAPLDVLIARARPG